MHRRSGACANSASEGDASVGPEQDDRHRSVKDAGGLVSGHLADPAATYAGPVHQFDLDVFLLTHLHETSIMNNNVRGLLDPKEPRAGIGNTEQWRLLLACRSLTRYFDRDRRAAGGLLSTLLVDLALATGPVRGAQLVLL